MKYINVIESLVLTLGLAASTSPAGAEPTNPNAIVQTMEANYGVHPGFRRNHAKGFCATGEFKATKDAKALSRSAVFDGHARPVVARFSSTTGFPTLPDTTNAPHGLALQFDLGKGVHHNMSMINVPIFVAATPEAFHDLLKAGTPDLIGAYKKKYPESEAFFAHMGRHLPPASFATASYHALNAFEFVNAKKKSQFVRWHFVPTAGEKELTKEELAKATPTYLEDEYKARVAAAPAQWTMVATLAEAGDNLTNSTQAWPDTRKTVTLGTLTLSTYAPQATGPCNAVNFDPNRVSDGVKTSDDPVLKFRAPAYAVSFGKRMSDQVERAPSQAADAPHAADAP